jgi:RNA polymerase subunit RPABC4/transcription elongation factor Spt4
MYCSKCGAEINDDAAVCIHCGVATQNMNKSKEQPIIINNSSSSSAVASNPNNKVKKKYSLLLDLILICCTGGLWIIWMLIRPKYEY